MKEAENLAKELVKELKKIDPEGKSPSPGKDEFLLVFYFFIRKKSFQALKNLFELIPPKRSEKTPEYWEKVKQILEPLTDRFNEEEFSYLLGWTKRLLEYEFSK